MFRECWGCRRSCSSALAAAATSGAGLPMCLPAAQPAGISSPLPSSRSVLHPPAILQRGAVVLQPLLGRVHLRAHPALLSSKIFGSAAHFQFPPALLGVSSAEGRGGVWGITRSVSLWFLYSCRRAVVQNVAGVGDEAICSVCYSVGRGEVGSEEGRGIRAKHDVVLSGLPPPPPIP